MNSLSVVDRDTTLCLLLPQLSKAKLDGPVKAKTYPDVDFMSAPQNNEMLSISGGSWIDMTGAYS